MLPTDDTGVEHTGLRVEGVDGRVDTKLSNGTRQHSGGVQVGEGRGRGGIRQIISGHVDGLHGGDGTLLGGGDTLLPVGRKGNVSKAWLAANQNVTHMPPMSVDSVGW